MTSTGNTPAVATSPGSPPSVEAEPTYYAEGEVVHKRHTERKNPDGTSTVSVGFPVCKVTDWVGEEGAPTVAAMLTVAEAAEENRLRAHLAETRAEAAEARATALEAALKSARGWMRHWEQDIAVGLLPTVASLTSAREEADVALSTLPPIQEEGE